MDAAILTRAAEFVREGVSWDEYQRRRSEAIDRNRRMTFTHGMLEIMSPSSSHERVKYLIGRMIDVWTDHQDIAVRAGGSTTLQRRDLEAGLEPDNCYNFGPRGHSPLPQTDISGEFPPELAVEIELSRSAIPKLPIYAALQVSELWIWAGEELSAMRLNSTGVYVAIDQSVSLPGFPLSLAGVLLRSRNSADDTTIIREFRRRIQSTVIE